MTDNPLKQYFRRPAIYVKLPSGGRFYDSSVLDLPPNNELPIYPMTALDEITVRTPDALFNGSAVADVIKSCVPAIKDPWKINSIDLDAILIAIRVASTGDDMEIESECPACKNEAKYSVNLVSMLTDIINIDYESTLKIRDLEIKFRPLSYAESNKNNMAQYEIQKMLAMLETFEDNEERQEQTKKALNRLNEITSEIVSATIEYIKTPETVVTNKEYIADFLKNCDKKANETIKNTSIELKNKNQLKPFKMKCMSCEHQYNQSLVLNMTDFFE